MDKVSLILLMAIGLSFSTCYNLGSSPFNTSIDVNPLTYDCIYDAGSNTTYNITIPKTNNIIGVDYTHNGTDIQNNTYYANRVTIDPTYRTNDIVSVPWNGSVTNPTTNTVYNVALLFDTRNLTAGSPAVNIRGVLTSCNSPPVTPVNTTLNVGQSIVVNNNTVSCILQPQAPVNLTSPQTLSLFNGSLVVNCRDNITRNVYVENVSSYTVPNANITVNCLRNINSTLTDQQVFYDNVTNTTLRQFAYKQNLVWNLTMETTQHNDICNITAIAPTRQSLYRGGVINVGVDQGITDILSGTNYTGPTLDQVPYRKTNVVVNFTAPQIGVEPLTNTTFACNVRVFPTNVTYQSPSGTSKFFAPVSLDYFNTYCTEEEKQNLSLDGCIQRLSSPEVWQQRVNATEQLTQQCYRDKDLVTQNASLCNAALTGNKAASDNLLLLVGGGFASFMVILIIAGLIMYYKRTVKPPVRTQRPIPSRGMEMNNYFESKGNIIPTKPSSADNKMFLPEGLDE